MSYIQDLRICKCLRNLGLYPGFVFCCDLVNLIEIHLVSQIMIYFKTYFLKYINLIPKIICKVI